jgi:hypothetical protein
MSTTTSAVRSTGSARTRNTPARTRRTRILAVLGAAAASLAVWAVAGPLAGVDLRVHVGTRAEHVGPATVVIASVVTGLVAWALLAVLERFTPRARAAWTVNALVALAVSLAGPLTSGTTTAAKLTLTGMHVATAVVLVLALPDWKASR